MISIKTSIIKDLSFIDKLLEAKIEILCNYYDLVNRTYIPKGVSLNRLQK